jgi:hypothetical protein
VLVYLRKYTTTGEEKKPTISYKQRGMSGQGKVSYGGCTATLEKTLYLYVLFVMQLTISDITRDRFNKSKKHIKHNASRPNGVKIQKG